MGVVKENMTFSTFNDFYVRRKIIKSLFQNLNQDMKEIYKMYLYSNRILSTQKADCMWEYLNEPRDSGYFKYESDLRLYYRKDNKSGDNK